MTTYESELYHHGILGQKWGVRRYQNEDGSYTKAGLKRYEKSRSEYEHQRDRYETNKAQKGKNSADTTNARVAMQQAKKRMNKDYKHLKQDKLGDKGKVLYSKGYRIGKANNVTSLLSTVGGLGLSAAYYNRKTMQLGNDKATAILGSIGAAATVGALTSGAYSHVQNKKMRAYYGHTSNY